MLIERKHPVDVVTYCTNIHPGESWAQVFANLGLYVPRVKHAVSPGAPFPIGLRLSGRAAEQVDAATSARFLAWCGENGCFVTTVNGFPYGPFHGVSVKEMVYLPDWRSPIRAAYTGRLADLLARWLPPGRRGSISTVPLGFRAALSPEDWPSIRKNLVRSLEHLDAIAQSTGKEIQLSLEPEPACVLETTPDVVRFFSEADFPPHLRARLGICYDCCHQALQFEDPEESLGLLADHCIPIGHVQVSSALHLEGDTLEELARFDEPVYLHQTVGRKRDGSLVRFRDLPEALRARPREIQEWRVHFHVPVFLERLSRCRSTQAFLSEALPRFPARVPMEVETYTWSVLPPELRTGPVTDSIAREIRWTAARRGFPPEHRPPALSARREAPAEFGPSHPAPEEMG
jgi:hypothetical protein